MKPLAHRRRWTVAVLVAAVVAVAAAVLPPHGSAVAGETFVVKTVREQGTLWIAGGGRPMRPGRLSGGNRLFEVDDVVRDGRVRGVFTATILVADPGTVSAGRATGLMQGVYRFPDGDVYVQGYVSFARPSASGAIIGGTGKYTGARGTFTSTEQKDVLHVQP